VLGKLGDDSIVTMGADSMYLDYEAAWKRELGEPAAEHAGGPPRRCNKSVVHAAVLGRPCSMAATFAVSFRMCCRALPHCRLDQHHPCGCVRRDGARRRGTRQAGAAAGGGCPLASCSRSLLLPQGSNLVNSKTPRKPDVSALRTLQPMLKRWQAGGVSFSAFALPPVQVQSAC
jgi:hypothetical protein